MSGQYEHIRFVPQRWAWALVVLVCAAILAWGYANYRLVPDLPRQWDYPLLPDTPSESAYSSAPPSASQPVPRQLAPLPEARTQPAAQRGQE